MIQFPSQSRVALDDLRARAEYESWLLEAVYDVAESPIVTVYPDQLIYPVRGTDPERRHFGHGNLNLCDWRPKFLEVGAPLVLVASFKLIDMLLEWVLEQNGTKANFRFSDKIKRLKKGVLFPDFLDSRPWLGDRLIGLYVNLEPLRGTIIHNRHFKSSGSTLEIFNIQRDNIGPAVTVTHEQLRSLGFIAVSLLRYLTEDWKITAFQEKQLRWFVDRLQTLHQLPSLGQYLPMKLTVRVYRPWTESINVDLKRIRNDISQSDPERDVEFDLKVVAIDPDQRSATAYLLPWDTFSNTSNQLVIVLSDIAKQQCSLPDDINVETVVREIMARTTDAG